MSAVADTSLSQARHVLVVATQCPQADQDLPDLADVADQLHRTLTDPSLGACQDGGVADAESLRSGRAKRETVDTAVREAIVLAGQARAVLVLAFLGHGQSPKGSPHLYYMAHDSDLEDAGTSVDVHSLITAAVNRRGVAGVVVLLDTCQSGAALPSAGDLVGGFRDGQTRFSVLAAAPAQEPAYDLDFSRQLMRHIRTGFDEAGEFVPMRYYREALTADLPDQDALAFEYDGLPKVEKGLWLSVNTRRKRVRAAHGLGTIGAADLGLALHAWPEGGGDAAARCQETGELVALRDRAADSPDFAALRVYEVVDNLLLVREAELFLVKWAGHVLTSFSVRRAMAELNTLTNDSREPMRAAPGLTGSELLRHWLEHAALRTTDRDGHRTPADAVARCLVAVAHACGLDPAGDELREWADVKGLTLEVNDAREWARQLRLQGRAGLVVSLHAARYDWPESLTVWLRQGTECTHAETFACAPTQAGVEQTLTSVLDWAEERLPPDVRLDHIDMVVRAELLPTWRPEEAEVGLFLLGVDRSVVLRWADRLFVPRYLRRMNEMARRRLEAWQHQVLTTGEAPVDWVNASSTPEVEEVRKAFKTGSFQRAAGIGRRSSVFAELIQVLLPYTPVLLWPDEETGVVSRPPAVLARLWERLPADFIRAQRLRWAVSANGVAAGPPSDEGVDLAELALLRAAWHDLPWLDFCDSFQEKPTLSNGGT
ncbi:hypothetical protein OG521_27260 [Streptomyces sp. NBC_01463]|uniref:vWA-MoxR associated conflict system protein n=1 Tax=Streptomyces sp. RTGN2 TaxID=3016525 RepID=UPI0025543808|nr:hypothetical protein [Streptomyces sp. RTGN2]